MKHRFLLLASGLVLATAPAAAQEYAYPTYERDAAAARIDSLRNLIDDRHEAAIGELAVRFWEPKLAQYKARFDEIFSVNDLAGLNELRVRFSMFVAQMQKEEAERKERYKSGSYDYMDTTAMTTTPTSTTEIAVASPEVDTVAVAAYDGDDYVYDPVAERRRQHEYRVQQRIEDDARMAEREAALSRGEASDMSAYGEYGYYQAWMELPAVSKWLARRYRSNLDHVAEQVFTDLRSFVDTLTAFNERFKRENSALIDQVPYMREELDDEIDLDEVTRMLRHPLTLRHTYISMVEPWVLLYDGEGLAKLVGSVTKSSAISSMPEVSLVEQNVPNPASDRTQIVITLPEPSSATMVRLYNGQGEEVLTLDQGALAAGSHTVTIEVADLPTGSYLYQVSAHLAGGEKVTAKLMQVVQ
jgi:hypothetical protein